MKNYINKCILCSLLALCITNLFSQSETQVTSSGYIEEDSATIANIPLLALPSQYDTLELDTGVNNSDFIFFPRKYNENDSIIKYIYSQNGNGSCAAVASVFYNLTYELNRVRNKDGISDTNKYPPNFTWNFLNGGSSGTASSFVYNLDIIKSNGCANAVDFGSLDPDDYTRWMSGYEKYHNSHLNKIEGYSIISSLYDSTNLLSLKHWLDHHHEDSDFGGIAFYSVIDGAWATTQTLSDSSAYSGEYVIVNWGQDGDHGMSIVGYSDNVKYDWGGSGSSNNIQPDGEFSNTKDNNFDGVIDVRDWEIGAFNVVGQMAVGSGNNGFVWILYKTVAENTDTADSKAWVLNVDDDYEPEIEIKGEIVQDKRSMMRIKYGKKDKANDPPPSTFGWKYTLFDYAGGLFPMQGDSAESNLEFSIDFNSEITPSTDFGKVFIKVRTSSNADSNTIIKNWSIVDRRWDEYFEICYPDSNLVIAIGDEEKYGIPYDLIPHENNIASNLTLNSDMVCRFNPTVQGAITGATLTIDDGVQIDMYESELEISSNSTLVIDDNVKFVAKDGICKITVDGTFTIGTGVQFLADDEAQLEIRLNKTNQTITIDDAEFDRAALISYIDDLTVKNSTFTDGGIYAFNGDIEINNVDFQDSWAHCSSADYGDSKVTVTGGCTFENANTYALKIDDYPEFLVENNTFTSNNYGIYVLYSGDGRYTGEIKGNTITGCSQTAIQVYYSDVDISQNIIHVNDYGIKSLNGSTTGLDGGNTTTPAQYIKNNTYYEVYASSGAFPHHFSWNEIIDNDNTEAMVYYSGTTGTLYVTNNYWGGSTYFNPSTDLYPSALYVYNPIWDPYSKSTGVAESLYDGALEKITQENYAGAKSDLKELIEEHSSTVYAQAAVKKLFSMEAYSGEDYIGLKTYLEEEVSLEDGAELEKLRDFLITFCEIKQENWETAITWFEDVILDPETMEDSIFSIIDLGYTYLLMEEGGYKSAYTGAMLEHIPSSHEAYDEKREYLLSLIPGKQMSEEMQKDIQNLENGELLHNVPNPFSSSTQIWYKLDVESEVMIHIFDYTGKEIMTYSVGKQSQGHHHVDFSSDRLPTGIYFYNLELNGLVTDTKKMTLIK